MCYFKYMVCSQKMCVFLYLYIYIYIFKSYHIYMLITFDIYILNAYFTYVTYPCNICYVQFKLYIYDMIYIYILYTRAICVLYMLYVHQIVGSLTGFQRGLTWSSLQDLLLPWSGRLCCWAKNWPRNAFRPWKEIWGFP
jgi:hypothetical protein